MCPFSSTRFTFLFTTSPSSLFSHHPSQN
jgi:hypothetical protein